MMLDFIIPLIDKFFTGDVFVLWLVPIIILAFIACVPYIFRHFLRR